MRQSQTAKEVKRLEMVRRHREDPAFHARAMAGLRKANRNRQRFGLTEEAITHMSLAQKGKKKATRSAEHCASLSAMMKALWAKRRLSGELKVIARKISKTVKARIKNDPAYRKLVLESSLQGMRVAGILKPNKAEKKLGEILTQYFPREFRMNVDGKFTLSGKVPDFVNVNGKKAVIEMFGVGWHKPSEEKERKNIFAKYGFRTLVVWEPELRRPLKVVRKIGEFLSKGEKR